MMGAVGAAVWAGHRFGDYYCDCFEASEVRLRIALANNLG